MAISFRFNGYLFLDASHVYLKVPEGDSFCIIEVIEAPIRINFYLLKSRNIQINLCDPFFSISIDFYL